MGTQVTKATPILKSGPGLLSNRRKDVWQGQVGGLISSEGAIGGTGGLWSMVEETTDSVGSCVVISSSVAGTSIKIISSLSNSSLSWVSHLESDIFTKASKRTKATEVRISGAPTPGIS